MIRRDQARTPRGDIPALDGDPICDCQDFDGLHLTGLSVDIIDAIHASALAALKFPGEAAPRVVRLTSLAALQDWRIDDISTIDTPSLRKFLQHSR